MCLLFLLVCTFETYSQSCGVPASSPPSSAPCNLLDPYGIDFECDYRRSVNAGTVNMSNIYTVPVVIHLFHNNGPENISDSEIYNIMAKVNELYGSNTPLNDSKIRFKLARLDPEGNCTNGINRVQRSDPDRTVGSQWHNAYEWDESRYINIFIFRTFVGFGASAGFAQSLATYGEKITGDVIIASQNNAADFSAVIAHELGHFLNLIHSNESCVNTDCLINGDRVCDTEPYTAATGSLSTCIINACVIPNTLKWDNVMHSVLNPCMAIFTPGQAKRLRYTIEWAGMNLTSTPNNLCTGSDALYVNTVDGEQVINSSYTYDFSGYPAPIQLSYSIRVKPGATLNIGAGVELRMCGGSKIIVEPNGKLFLYGKLTNSCDKYWEGIEVYGTNVNDNQNYNTNPAVVPFGYKQGYIQCFPGSMIENARTAIKLYGPENKNGGVAYCDGLTIKNCKIGVDIDKFGLNNAVPYKANFRKCNFITNDDYLFENEEFCGIDITEVKGVIINSCEFINTKDRKPFPALSDFGYGIKSVDAGFELGRACQLGTSGGSCVPERRNKFSGLAYGVFNAKAAQGVSASSIKSADFIDCYYGIHERGSVLQTILFNTFTLGNLSHPDLVDAQAGIVFEDTYSNMICEENTFTGISGNKTDRIGIVADNMGLYTNNIRRNSFSNLKIANLVNGFCGNSTQSGLKYFCNTNSANYGNDFLLPVVTDQLTRYQSWAIPTHIGGFIDYAANNTFSHAATPYGDFENNGPHYILYHYKNVPAQKPENTFVVSKIVADEISDACAVKYCEQPCLTPDKDGLAFHGGSNTGALKGLYNSLRNKYNDEKSKDPSMPSEKKSVYERQLMQLAADVAHYMAYDTVHQVRDSIAVWNAKIENIKNGTSFLVKGEDGHSYEAALQEKYSLGDGVDNSPLRQYAHARIQSLRSDADGSDQISSVRAKNMLTAIGYHYAPDFHFSAVERHTALETVHVPSAFDIYPNPTNGIINIGLTASVETARCTVYDNLGGIVSQSWVSQGAKSFIIDLSTSLPGIYYVELSDETGSLGVKKFIITR